MEHAFQILRPGIDCNVLSSPKHGHRDLGVVGGGAMDTWSAQQANILVNNHPSECHLEIPCGPVVMLAKKKSIIAITGHGHQIKINGNKRLLNHALLIEKGDRLEILNSKKSGTAYFAINGGIHPDKLKKQPIDKNSLLSQHKKTTPPLALLGKGIWQGQPTPVIRILIGPDIDVIEKKLALSFFESPWQIARARNRMGIKLSASLPTRDNKSMPSLPSHGVIPGTIQMSSPDRCIALMPNCQTTGGYPRIATIIQADLWKLAQLPADSTVTFNVCNASEAKVALQKKIFFISRMRFASNYLTNKQ